MDARDVQATGDGDLFLFEFLWSACRAVPLVVDVTIPRHAGRPRPRFHDRLCCCCRVHHRRFRRV